VADLSSLTVLNAKPRARDHKLADRDGLYLLVRTGGAKLWRFDYRFSDKRKTMAFGQYPDVGLAEAREKLREAREHLAHDRDPMAEAVRLREVARLEAANSFEAVAEEWYKKCEDEALAAITLRKIRWLLEIAYESLRTKPVTDITPQEALAVLRKLEGTGRRESARRMRSVLNRVFRYAIHTGRAKDNPASDLRGAIATPRVTHIAAITKADQVGALMRRIDSYTGHAITVIALQVSPHVFVRPGELRRWEWAEINWEQAYWDIPEEKMKRRIPLRVPLSRQVQAKIVQLWEITGGGKYLFPSFRTPLRTMSENTVNAALRGLGYAQDEMTAHGFRSMADSLLNETGLFNPDAIERQLAHQDKNSVRRIYMRAEFWAERVRMMQYWSDYLEELRDRIEPAPARPASAAGGRPVFGATQQPALALAHNDPMTSAN
jgi:integrase